MNRELKEFLTYKALAFKHSNASAMDSFTEGLIEEGEANIEMKNVCAKLTKQLSDDIDETVNFLDIRKRQFIELAIIQALEDAKRIIDEVISSDEDWIEANRTDKEPK